jgi:hypothetical protein
MQLWKGMMWEYFFFYFTKISFPVHFLFKWRQNLSAHPRTTAGHSGCPVTRTLDFPLKFGKIMSHGEIHICPPVAWYQRVSFWTTFFLGTLAKLRKATVGFVMSVYPSVLYVPQFSWNSSAATGRILMDFDIWLFFETLSRKVGIH